jgi:hypothetical protein
LPAAGFAQVIQPILLQQVAARRHSARSEGHGAGRRLDGRRYEGELEVGSAMKPKIDRTAFGSVTIDGEVYEHDVLIRLDGQVKKRKKKLSKAVYGTSHTISLAEARHVHQKGADRVIIGAGQDGRVTLSDEAAAYFEQNGCKVDLRPTPEAIPAWNDAQGHVIGLLHVTC